MKNRYPKLRIEQLEDRVTPATVAIPLTVTTGGAQWTVSNKTSGPFNGTSGSVPLAFAIATPSLTGPGLGDAYNGAFELAVNGIVFSNPDGTVDLTGTTVTSDVVTIAGLDTQVQYFFDTGSPTIRALYSFTNNSGSNIWATASVGHDVGSDDDTTVEATSNGDTTIDRSDRWLVTSDTAPLSDPVNTFVRFGPGGVATVPRIAQALGATTPTGTASENEIDVYDLHVPTGATRHIMVFGQLSETVADAQTGANVFNSNAALRAAGLLDGLTQEQLAQTVNWNFGAVSKISVGAGAGGTGEIRQFNASNNNGASFSNPFPGFLGDIRTATGDVNGDGVADDIAAAGPGGGPNVIVFDGATGAVIHNFFAFDTAFTGGVYVAAGDVNGDGLADIITGAGPGGGPNVKVFDGGTMATLRDFFAYAPAFAGGVRVGAGDINGDGFSDVITGAGPGGGPNVKVFDGDSSAEIVSFLAFDASFTNGVYVAGGDVDGDGTVDIVVGSGAGAPPIVRVFTGDTNTLIRDFFAFDPAFTGGVRVAAGDTDRDGFADIIAGAGSGGGPHVIVFDGETTAMLSDFFAFETSFTGGIFVSTG